MSNPHHQFDYLIIGGGFYGCCLALYLCSISSRILLVEAEDKLMQRASRVNQARVHSGFHYPRSVVTAVKSGLLCRRFLRDFPDAVIDDFQMLYAIARRRSKVTAKKFYRMFSDMGAPIEPASPNHRALFNDDMIEAVFACYEAAFDYSALQRQLSERLLAAAIDLRLSTELQSLTDTAAGVVAGLSDGTEVSARYAFNITYARINAVLARANLPQARLKHEVAELALIRPPAELEKIGVTVMDGPFFSCMPYPPAHLHSLTHVRYTPHESWTDAIPARDPYACFAQHAHATRQGYMLRDAARYLPCLAGSEYRHSMFDIKTVLVKNEQDDGRPILYQQQPAHSRVISILGGKMDNIYDLFDQVRAAEAEFTAAHDGLVMGRGA